mmetsp:Transcript_6114/g.10567  ORF Transcript_6114/g.10567 Transcript_6114/m.10567 type:complete len:247 (-) Transcript_6114:1035-1775(-)
MLLSDGLGHWCRATWSPMEPTDLSLCLDSLLTSYSHVHIFLCIHEDFHAIPVSSGVNAHATNRFSCSSSHLSLVVHQSSCHICRCTSSMCTQIIQGLNCSSTYRPLIILKFLDNVAKERNGICTCSSYDFYCLPSSGGTLPLIALKLLMQRLPDRFHYLLFLGAKPSHHRDCQSSYIGILVMHHVHELLYMLDHAWSSFHHGLNCSPANNYLHILQSVDEFTAVRSSSVTNPSQCLACCHSCVCVW